MSTLDHALSIIVIFSLLTEGGKAVPRGLAWKTPTPGLNDGLKVVKIVAVHGGGLSLVGTVDVQPLVKLIDGNRISSSHSVVYGIPYFRIHGGSNAIIIDPAVGDIGFVICSDRDISSVKATKSAGEPWLIEKV